MLIGTYRQQIDAIDTELLNLIQNRMDVVQNVATYKMNKNVPVLDSQREAEIIEEMRNAAKPKYREHIEEFFVEILKLSRDMQNNIINKAK